MAVIKRFNVNNLEQDINEYKHPMINYIQSNELNGINLISDIEWSFNKQILMTGLSTLNYFAVSDFIEISEMTALLVCQTYEHLGIWYDSDKNPICYIFSEPNTEIRNVKKSYSNSHIEKITNNIIFVPSNAKYIRINMLISYIDSGTCYMYDWTHENKMEMKTLYDEFLYTPLPVYARSTGYLHPDGTIEILPTAVEGNLVKYEIPANQKKLYIVTRSGISNDIYSIWSFYWILDENENLIYQYPGKKLIQSYKSDDVNSVVYLYINVPENGKYLWINTHSIMSGIKQQLPIVCTINDKAPMKNIVYNLLYNYLYDTTQNIENNISNHWDKKIWYAYGTSLTSIAQGTYANYVKELSGLNLMNKGIPGGGIIANRNIYNAVMNDTDGKKNADLITLEVLANDGTAEIGEITDLSNTTFLGSLGLCLKYLQENTNAQIVLIASMMSRHSLNNSNDKYLPGSDYINRQTEIINKMEELAKMYGVYFINPNIALGIYRKTNAYIKDNIHHTDLGGKIYGKYIWSKLKDIPTWDIF